MAALLGAALSISSSSRGRREVDRQGTDQAREAEPDRGVRLTAGVVGAASVLERTLERLLHRADLAAPPIDVRQPDQQRGYGRVVSRGLEGRQRAVHLVSDRVDAALGADEQADHRRGQPRGNGAAGVAGLLGRRNRGRVQILRACKVADLEVRLGLVDEQRGVSRSQSRGTTEEVRCGVRVVARERSPSCTSQPLGRPSGEDSLGEAGRRELDPIGVRLREMVTEDLVELRRCRGPGLDPVGTALVQVGAKALRHRVVRRVAYEDVGEDEAVLAGERARVGADQPFPDERLERAGDLSLLLGRRQVGDGAPPEHLADHGRTLEDRALERLEPVEPRGEHGLDGLGNADRLDVGQRLQASLALHERAFLDEHAQHLLEEERIAAGCAADGVGGVLVERARQILEQLPRVVALQRRQLDRRRSGPCRPQLREIAAGETADENRRVASPAREVLDQIEKRRLRPLDVVENEQHGPLRASVSSSRRKAQ